MFHLDHTLATDTTIIGHFPLSTLLLSNDSNYPWCILVPCRENITEIYQLNTTDQQQLLLESSHLAKIMMRIFKGYKMNVAALGNVVSQLHLHHVVRYQSDATWPDPIWGKIPAKPYSNDHRTKQIEIITASLENGFKRS